MKKTSLTLSIILLLFATNAWGEGLTLECKGSASLDSIGFGKNIFSSTLLFYMDEENNKTRMRLSEKGADWLRSSSGKCKNIGKR